MKLVVISYPEKLKAEERLVQPLFENGMEYFHLRKPGWKKEQLASFLKEIPCSFHKKIIIHSQYDLTKDFELGGIHIKESDKKNLPFKEYKTHSIAIHNLNELSTSSKLFKYALLSPVFKSISKKNVNPGFNIKELNDFFKMKKNTIPVYALGGINRDNIVTAKKTSFNGAAVLGYVWNTFKESGHKKALDNFIKLNALCL